MTFESIWPLALLLTVPVVVILYLLRPRGKDYRISSTLLWDKLLRNQQSRTVLQKFIHNILMYLQILILVLLVLALMSPYLSRQGKSGGSRILVFDTSGSMQHDGGDGKTRMEKAVAQAKDLIEASEGTAFSVVTNGCAGTNVLAVGITDKKSLSAALNQIACCDGPGNLEQAESTVEMLKGAGQKGEEDAAASEVILFTDGNGAEEALDFSRHFDARVFVVGDAVSNVANNFLTYEETEEKERDGGPGREEDVSLITCASSLTNYSDAEAQMEVSLYEGDRLLEVRTFTLPPGETSLCYFHAFEWEGEPLRSEVGSVKFMGKDDSDSLAGDNTAYAVKRQEAETKAVLIGDGNTYIEKAYQAAVGESLTRIKEESALPEDARDIRIYDAGAGSGSGDHANAMLFGAEDIAVGTAEKVALTVTDCELTEGLSPFTIGVNRTAVYEIPDWGMGFLWAGGQCAGYYGEHDGVRTVVVGFDIRESDFPLKAEFPVFMANALRFLGDASILAENTYEAGEPVLFHPRGDLETDLLDARTEKAGLYEVSVGDATEAYVVRFDTGTQSDGRITAEGTVPETFYGKGLVKRQLRNVLLAVVLALLAAEWVIYVRRTRCRSGFYLGVRIVGVFLLLLALFGFSVGRRNLVNTTVFLVDLSDSNRQNLSAMEEDLKSALERMSSRNQYGIVTFGKNAVVDQFLTQENHFSEIMSLPDKEATNFEDAFSRALTMIPADSAGRIVVMTDGKETRGNLANAAFSLSSWQVELLAFLYETKEGQDAYVENVELPGYLYQGDLYSMTVTVVSNYETDAEIQIWMGETKTEQYSVHLNRGTNQFRFRQSVAGESVESFEVRVIAPGDTCGENDSYHAYSVIDSVPRVLLVAGMGEDSSLYENLLQNGGCDFDVVTAAGAPDSLEKLLEYKSVLLENVYLADLPEGFLSNVETYVKDYGCGLVCIGGDDSFALGGYRDSVLETVLPVEMELRGTGEIPTTLMIMVIDRSGSMSMESGAGASNLDLAVTAAKTAVDQMRDTDLVGVIAFDDTSEWVVEPVPAGEKEEIKAQIETIAEGGGTTIKPALWEALRGAETCDGADIRHVILLTDGQGEDRNFRDVTEAYGEESVTLSTVAVGADSDRRLLEQLARDCGGRYYYSDMASEIPRIFAQEVFLSGDAYLQNGLFRLAVDSGNEITDGLFERGWPDIYGYVSATPKSASRVLIASDKDDPVLSTMQYGLGHTVAWNTDVTNEWTAAYAGENDYVQLWRRIVDYSVGNAAIGEDSVDVDTEGGFTHVVYHAVDDDGQTKIEAVYTDPEGNTRTKPLKPTAPGRYETELDTDITGLYNLSVRRLNQGTVANAVTTAVAVQYSDEYKFDAGTDSFTRFVERCGKMADPVENFWQQKKGGTAKRYELTKWLILALIFWFMFDIAVRRFHFLPQETKLYQRALRYRAKRGRKETGEKRKQPTGDLPEEHGKTEDFAGKAPSGERNKRKNPKKSDKRKESETLDTSALLRKKDQRKQL